MVQPGILLNDRYEIIEKIGTGGMSIVYKARCTKLERYVAIKVLREEFCLDEQFVKRFRVEAQSAASLSHSNIVNIYDVGNDSKTHYIVMEHLEGKTLKEYIKEKGHLEDSEVLKIGACIASALEHAHVNHIIHRDIKPQNIIITNDGKVKVADFGIARMATDATINANDIASGSVHYIAPEQARGGVCDYKSDIYSLGITMYEMATGFLPFTAETAVSIALKHIHDQLPAPSNKNANISKGLEQIIIKSTQKKAEMRYQSAKEMLDDLKKAQNFPNEEFININSFQDDSPTIIMTDSDFDEIRKRSDDNKNEENGEKKQLDKVVGILGIICAVFVVTILSVVIFNIVRDKILPIEVDVPVVEGLLIEDAKILLDEHGIKYNITEEYSTASLMNYIIKQTPEAGIIVLENKEDTIAVDLIVGKGEQLVKVPNVVNLSFDNAEQNIEDANLIPDRVLEYHDIIEVGHVIRQVPEAGEQLKLDEVVTIYVSQGKEKVMVEMPNIIDKPENIGIEMLEAAGLAYGNTTYINHELIAEGNIITANVEHGQKVEENYVVNLVVSEGSALVTRPLIINDILPLGQNEGLVQVYLLIDGTKEIVYDQTVQRTDFPININVQGRGTSTIEVYLDGYKEYSNTVVFDEVTD